MFERNENGNTLHNHLIDDGFFVNGVNYLLIIDDYHTKDIKQDAIEFYREAFQGVGLRTITIYYQIKKIWDETMDDIYYLSNQLNINQNELITFLVFLLTSVNSNNGPLESRLTEIYSRGTANRQIQSSLQFIDAMESIGINVRYKPYTSLRFKPPFHGRYWINQNAGYIVDGSLNTFTNGRVFAQKMDTENFNIISNLMNNEIKQRAEQYSVLTGQRIIEIHTLLTHYFNRV